MELIDAERGDGRYIMCKDVFCGLSEELGYGSGYEVNDTLIVYLLIS